ncbi:hypothetical protein ABZ135_26510 [Streptomyces sp. NPDC006339]|uniref:hypothetical protein n=1 Tax=Streptomyces sp. NPDC006339 TaxID=3156755 RepID=UPI0033B99BDC
MTTAAPALSLTDRAAYDLAVEQALAAAAAYYADGDTVLDDASKVGTLARSGRCWMAPR